MERRHRLIPAALAALASLAGAAPAFASHRAPLVLPRDTSATSAWIVAGRDGPAAQRLARSRDARAIGRGVFVLDGPRAKGLARSLARRGLLRWAEPDRSLRRASAGPRTAVAPASWRDRLGVDGLTPPPVAAGSPWLAFVDTPVDLTHPALAGPWVTSAAPTPPIDLHGTATAAVAAAVGPWPGVWPGMRVRSFPMTPETMTCSTSAELIGRAVRAGASTINMSFGGRESCFSEYAALQDAVRHGVVVVAAAGNDFTLANDVSYPAAFPHVVTAAALGLRDTAAYFSSSSDATDLAAPGQRIVTAVPPQFDDDGTPDGWEALSGTSFSAPMVAAAATWVRAARPSLTADQVGAVLCRGARDVGRAGWDRRTGCGALDVAGALRAVGAAAGSCRAQRRRRLGRRHRIRPSRGGGLAGRRAADDPRRRHDARRLGGRLPRGAAGREHPARDADGTRREPASAGPRPGGARRRRSRWAPRRGSRLGGRARRGRRRTDRPRVAYVAVMRRGRPAARRTAYGLSIGR